ncbi:malate dehydrogenase [Gordonia sp. TBRC 11910]|uniref:Malate dehydrogenase n=1 Tax=Gordonia asplenii TaxID=2725283 RepID=A0A848L5D7_9ACTN|nr:malate dehydrogenase [Gordonia asplenii]NMO03771.1 malate dehydrogenase [Gordonia asplenii]
MTVHGADSVDAVIAAGANRLIVGRTDIVTPLARERARDAKVEIVVEATTASAAAAIAARVPASTASAPVSAAPVPVSATPAPSSARPASVVRRPGPHDVVGSAPPAPLSPPSPALYRRGAPVPADVLVGHGNSASRRPSNAKVGRVTVVGAGNVGMIAAMRLAESDVIDEVVLVDIAGQRAAGIALDIAHASPLLGFATRVRGVNTLAEAGPSDYVVITAGKARTPGMSRTDLVDTNAAIVGALAADAALISPDAVLLIVTNPLDEMTEHAWRTSGFPTSRVIGMAGVLDSSRFRALTASRAGVHPREVSAVALGSHGAEMVMPLSQATVSGRPVTEALSGAQVDALVDRARNSGAEVVGLLKSGSAFFTPGLAAARMVLSMIDETGEVQAATVAPHGEYGIDAGYVGLPVRLGRRGLDEIVEVPLTDAERRELRTAADRIAERVSALSAVTS